VHTRGENLVRFLSSKEKLWTHGDLLGDVCWYEKQQCSTAELSKTIFTGIDDDPVSVFVAAGHRLEAEAAAAQNLMRKNSPKQPVWLVRIPIPLVTKLDISIRPTPGDTGVRSIDALHRDLHGKAAAFTELTAALLGDKRSGLDLVRIVGPATLCQVYESFSSRGENELNSSASKSAKTLAQNYRGRQTP
jgi:hypothetical protein